MLPVKVITVSLSELNCDQCFSLIIITAVCVADIAL